MIASHCKGQTEVVVYCTFYLVKVFSSPYFSLYVPDDLLYFLLRGFVH